VGGAGRTAATPNLNQGKIFIGDANNKSSTSVYTLPIADGTNGQALVTDGSGAVSFGDVAVSQTLTIIGRSTNYGVNLTSGSFTIVGRSGNISIGV